MNSKQKAVDNITNYLNKRIERNERKLLDYRDREKVYGLRYENKKDVIHAENELQSYIYDMDANDLDRMIFISRYAGHLRFVIEHLKLEGENVEV